MLPIDLEETPMESTSPITSDKFKSFLDFEREVLAKIEKPEPFFKHVFIEVFPDITCVLSWPILKETALFKKISKNIDSIALCVIISSLAATSISSLGLFIYTASPLKAIFITVHITGQAALILLSGAYLKKYFLLKRNHTQVKTILVVVKALFKQIHDLSHLNEQHKEENQKQASHNKESTELLNQLKKHAEEEILRHAQEKKELKEEAEKVISSLRNAPKKLERILGQIELLTPTASLLTKQADDLKNRILSLQKEHEQLTLQNGLLSQNISLLQQTNKDLSQETAHLKNARSLLVDTCQEIHRAASDLTWEKPSNLLNKSDPEYVLA